MRRHTGLGRTRLVVSIGGLCVVAIVGCSPSTQKIVSAPGASTQTQAVVGSPTVDSSGWQAISQSVQLGEAATMFKVKMDVDAAQGALHNDFSVYGSVNMPDRALLGYHVHNSTDNFYQQGLSAYVLENKRWEKTNAVADLNFFRPYDRLVKRAAAKGFVVYRYPDTFVTDEYCHVYQVTIPANMQETLPIWPHQALADPGERVQYTFFVGKTSGELRQVEALTVGAIQSVGGLQVDSNTLLFDFNDNLAKIQLPKDLVFQLLSVSQQ